jgi:hypothetical protein
MIEPESVRTGFVGCERRAIFIAVEVVETGVVGLPDLDLRAFDGLAPRVEHAARH